MYMKSIFASASAGKQWLLLLLLMLFGSTLFSFMGIEISSVLWGTDVSHDDNPDYLRLIQFFSTLGTFLLPALGMAYLCGAEGFKSYFFLKIPDIKYWATVFVSMFVLIPPMALATKLNEQLHLPDWLAPVEKWMMEQEELMNRTTDLLINGGGTAPLLGNLVVIAATAAIAEEFFFRGVLTNLLGRVFRNYHVVIWTSAILFSACHLQFYGFLPRMLLGAYFGYLLYEGEGLWLSVFGHFVNNAVAILSMTYRPIEEVELMMGYVAPSEMFPFSVFALTCLAFFFVLHFVVFRDDYYYWN